jgi:hypothetical protein
MPCIRLADKSFTLNNNEMIVLKLYEALWGQGTKPGGLEVIFRDQYKVPHPELAEGRIVDAVVDNSKHSFRFIKLPDNVALPTMNKLQPTQNITTVKTSRQRIQRYRRNKNMPKLPYGITSSILYRFVASENVSTTALTNGFHERADKHPLSALISYLIP